MQGANFQKKREGEKGVDYHLNQTLHFADKETESYSRVIIRGRNRDWLIPSLIKNMDNK